MSELYDYKVGLSSQVLFYVFFLYMRFSAKCQILLLDGD